MNATQLSSATAQELTATLTGTTIAPATPAVTRRINSDSSDRTIASAATTQPTPGHGDSVPLPKRGHWRRSSTLRSVLLFTLFAAIIGYFGVRYWCYANSWVGTDNAYLIGHIHSVSSRVAGTVKEVLVDENQEVASGTVLAQLDASDFEVRRRQAAAQLAQATAQVQESQARIAQAVAQIDREQARATKANQDLQRATSLFGTGSGAISRQELDLARAESDAAEAALKAARSALDSTTASASAAHAQEKLAQAGLEDADLQLSYTQIMAPATGRIGKKNLETGNRVQPGQALLALVQPELWVTANFKETQLAHLRPGQAVRIKADAFPGRSFRGTVEGVSPASGAQFALLPPDNATGNFTKIVQRVPVKILLDSASLGDLRASLVAGMSVVVEVKVHD
ncbi:MAG TPA: HlyD family secretion protein [Verrucomicrobiae bacterium]|nr:HlyD family secretion protein [Verrucomicrobiae bacterium]